MRILNIMQCTDLGGTEQVSLRLMIGLKRLGHSCHVLSLNPLGKLTPLLQKNGISCEGMQFAGKGGWRSFPVLWSRLRKIETDAIIQMGQNLLATAALGDLCQQRRVYAVHYHHAGVKPDWQWRLIYRLARRRFRAIIFPSQFVCQEAKALCPDISGVAHVIPNPLHMQDIVTKHQRTRAREMLGIPIGARIIGNAGQLIRRKRFDVFLKVAKRVSAEIRDTVFVIAGDGEEKNDLKALAKDLGIESQVIWLGWQEDLTNFYLSLDVLLFNSDWDAMGMTPLESMSYGVPVVASVIHGGLKEVIDNDQVGFLQQAHDLEQLASILRRLLLEDELRQRVGRLGRQRVRTLSSIEDYAKKYEALLGYN